jgi:hypothetical protein
MLIFRGIYYKSLALSNSVWHMLIVTLGVIIPSVLAPLPELKEYQIIPTKFYVSCLDIFHLYCICDLNYKNITDL